MVARITSWLPSLDRFFIEWFTRYSSSLQNELDHVFLRRTWAVNSYPW